MAVPKVALIGLGLAVKPHAQSLYDLREFLEVRWAASRSEKRIADFGSRFPFPVTTEVDCVLEDPEVDCVILLTPPDTHLDLGRKCLENRKHLLVEKPLELNVERASALVEAAERSGRAFGVVLQHRFKPSSLRAAELIHDGALGRIETAAAYVPWWRPQSYYDEPGRGTLERDGGGVLLTQAIHTLDLFRSLVGVREVSAAQATTTGLHKMETEDFAAALLVLGDGAPGQFMATTAAYPGRKEEIHIVGTKGSLSLSGDALAFHGIDGKIESIEDTAGAASGEDPMAFSHEPHRALISDFLAAASEGRAPKVSGAEALETQKLIAQILATAGSSGAPAKGL